MSNPLYDQLAELADEANNANEQAGNEERVDLVFMTQHELDVTEARRAYHIALDKLLDALDADGGKTEDIDIIVQAYDLEENDGQNESIIKYVVEFADGEIEEMFAEHTKYKPGQQPETTRRQYA